jgi:hypothetical protein
MLDMPGRKKLVFAQRERGDLAIFKQPSEHGQYIIGADTAEGIDVAAIGGKSRGGATPDWNVAQVHDRDTGEQVARLRLRCQPSEFGYQLYMLGIYYFWAQIVPEFNNHGVAAIDSLLKHGYPSTLIYHRPHDEETELNDRSNKIGFKTTSVTRPRMISLLDDAITSRAITVHDATTQSELLTFVMKANGRAEHQYACHDDCVIAEALVCVGIEQMPRQRVEPLKPERGTQPDNYLHPPDSDQRIKRGERLRLL